MLRAENLFLIENIHFAAPWILPPGEAPTIAPPPPPQLRRHIEANYVGKSRLKKPDPTIQQKLINEDLQGFDALQSVTVGRVAQSV